MKKLDRSTPWLGGPGVFPALLVVACGIQYLCVPETDHIAGIALMAAGLTVIEIATHTTYGASRLTAVIVVVWAGWFGAAGRTSAELGAAAAFWPLVAGLGVQGLRRRIAGLTSLDAAIVAVICASASAVVARTGALQASYDSAVRSAAIWIPASVAASAIAVPVGRTVHHNHARPHRARPHRAGQATQPKDSLGGP